MDYLVKVGLMAAVGCFRSPDGRRYPRDAKVICRTARGLEVGTLLCAAEGAAPDLDGDLLRGLGPEDQLILARLDKFRERAYQACVSLLASRGASATLVDVEHLFDGESLYFYFLGEVDESLNQLTAELAATYERKVKFKRFAETLAEGCGPGCGTTASRCGTSGGCGSCGLAGKCG